MQQRNLGDFDSRFSQRIFCLVQLLEDLDKRLFEDKRIRRVRNQETIDGYYRI